MQINSKSEQTPLSQVEETRGVQTNTNHYQQVKKAQDIAILNASISSGAAENPLDLLYKTAIEEINKQLEPAFGENAAQSAYDSDLDVSPEATAQRIVQGATGFYQAFKEQNSQLDNEQSLDKFMSIISSGIETGFEEAKSILDSLKALEGEIETDINSTFDFVQNGLTQFKEQLLATFKSETANATNNESEELAS